MACSRCHKALLFYGESSVMTQYCAKCERELMLAFELQQAAGRARRDSKVGRTTHSPRLQAASCLLRPDSNDEDIQDWLQAAGCRGLCFARLGWHLDVCQISGSGRPTPATLDSDGLGLLVMPVARSPLFLWLGHTPAVLGHTPWDPLIIKYTVRTA